jgi:hypothetical protein
MKKMKIIYTIEYSIENLRIRYASPEGKENKVQSNHE